MDIKFLLFLAIVLAPLFWGIAIYNQLVFLKNGVKKAWSNIGVLLKQRNDELPKLIDTCKQHMKYEQETLVRVMQARKGVVDAMNNNNIPALAAAEQKLSLGLDSLFAVVENYPELKASESFQTLQLRIVSLEESIADRREFYNDSTNVYNTRIQQFPDLILAKLFSFKEERLMYFSMEETQDINIGAQFES